MPYPSHARVACTHDTPDTAFTASMLSSLKSHDRHKRSLIRYPRVEKSQEGKVTDRGLPVGGNPGATGSVT